MKYLVKTIKINGEEKIESKRDYINKKKFVYCVKSENGQVLTVDKEWLKVHKEDLVNVGISGNSLYLKEYNKNKVKRWGKLTDNECQQMIKDFGGKIVKLSTFCGNSCYISSKSETEHLIYIPSNVISLNSEDLGDTEFTPQIQELQGKLKVIGGSGLLSCEFMFYRCKFLQSIDLSYFDISKVENMSYMFYGCKSLKSLNLNNFNTGKVTNMEYMFAYCGALGYLDLRHFNTSKVKNMLNMFINCYSTVEGNKRIQKAFEESI